MTTETTTICESLRSVADAIESHGYEERVDWVLSTPHGPSVRVKTLGDLREMFPGESAKKTKYTDASHKFSIVVDGVEYWAAEWFGLEEKKQEPEQVTL